MNRFQRKILEGISVNDLSMYLREREESEQHKKADARFMYQSVISGIEFRMQILKAASEEERRHIISVYRRMISHDLSYSVIAGSLYKSDPMNFSRYTPPCSYYENGTMIRLECTESIMDIKSKYLIDYLQDDNKFYRHVFRKDCLDPKLMLNEEAPFSFENLELVIAGGGNCHRILDAYLNRDEVLTPVNVVHDRILLEKVRICPDGDVWVNKGTGEEIGKGKDFRLALIFTLRQMELGLYSDD